MPIAGRLGLAAELVALGVEVEQVLGADEALARRRPSVIM